MLEFEQDDADDSDDEVVEVQITPRHDVLKRLNIPLAAFETAVEEALDAYQDLVETLPEDDVPTIEDAAITLAGKEYSLGEVAEIVIEDDESE